ncbi:histidine phosphatase family protein [Amycolatopsis sp. NPDC048633]|uniref:histidine phosphatase family protein n=1 Tax=Amycolatopsis sp. NPDC048633 TaxID=3157095 RepID=UPI0033F4CC7F
MIRHGKTSANLTGVLDSLPPGLPLIEEGYLQAEKLAEALSGEPVVGVYASRATRAQQTAAPIAGRHGLKVMVLGGVHEVQLGDWEGSSDAESLQGFLKTFARWLEKDLDRRIPGGESAREVLGRFLSDVRAIHAGHARGGVAVLVSHGAAIRLASINMADNLDVKTVDARFIPNAEYVVMESVSSSGESWRCLEWIGDKVD